MKELIDKAEKAEPPRPLTPDECQIFDTLDTDGKKLDEQISQMKAHLRRAEASQKLILDLEKTNERKTKPADPQDKAEATESAISCRVPAHARASGQLKAFKPKAGETATEVELRAYRAGMWLRASVFRDVRAQQYCMSNGLGADIRNAMSTTSNPDGGFLVPDELSRTIIDLREQYGVFRREARVWPMGSDTLLIPRRAGGVTVAPVGENSLIGQSNPTFNMVQLVAKKIGGLCVMSSEIAADAVIDLADYVAQEFAYAFALFEDQMGFIGDGTATYHSVRGLGNLFTTTGGAGGGQLVGAVDAATNHDTFAEIDAVDLTAVMGKLPAYALNNAKWYTSAVGAQVVFNRLAASAGGNTTQTLRDGLGLSYLGYPIVISQVLPTSTGDLSDVPMLYFGDLRKAAQMGDRRMVEIARSNERYFEYDQIAIRGLERIDVVVSDVGDTTTGVAGPIVALVGD
jgi:HK97 family phage major capsid protein